MSYRYRPHYDRIEQQLHEILPHQVEFMYSTKSRSYREFMTELSSRFGAPSNALPLHMVAHMFRTMFFHSRFRRDGSHVFRVSEGLAGLLRFTNVGNIPSTWVRLPFDSLYIQLPDSPTLFTVAGKDMKGQDFQYPGIGICCVESVVDGVRVLNMNMAGIHPTDPLDDQTMNIELKLDESLNMEQVFAATKMTGQYLDPGTDAEKVREDLWQGIRLAINILLYINEPTAELSEPIKGTATLKLEQHPKKGEEWKRKMRRIASKEPIIIDVGKSIEPKDGFSPDSGHTYELSVRYVVRGHWRQQPCGPGNTERRLTWIAPYWKGPEWAEVVKRDYLVMDSTIDPQPTR